MASTHPAGERGSLGTARPPGATLPKAERRILTALAQYPQGRSKVQLAILTGYAVGGGGFANAIGALRSKGWVAGGAELLTATPAGLAALGPFEPLPRGPELLAHWLGQLGKAERAILGALAAAWPDALGKDEIAARTGYQAAGGGFNNAIGRLRTLELVHGRHGAPLQASADLMAGDGHAPAGASGPPRLFAETAPVPSR